MPDPKPRHDRPTPRKEKTCKTCGRPFAYRPEHAQDWDIVKFCSESCRIQKAQASQEELEQAILTLLAERGPNQILCPSEAAKFVAGDPRDKSKTTRRDWEALMEPVRTAARHLATRKKLLILQHDKPANPATAKGPILLRLP